MIEPDFEFVYKEFLQRSRTTNINNKQFWVRYFKENKAMISTMDLRTDEIKNNITVFDSNERNSWIE